MMNKILIVEDEFSISNFMKTVLEGDGYTVEVATCAAQARAALEKMEFSAMLLDLGLPDADGLKLLRELREQGVCIRNLGRALASGAFLYDARNIRKRGTEHETHGETQ